MSFDLDAVLHEIWWTLGACGTSNRNDQLAIAIMALIEAGVQTRSRIIGAVACLGFNASMLAPYLAK